MNIIEYVFLVASILFVGYGVNRLSESIDDLHKKFFKIYSKLVELDQDMSSIKKYNNGIIQ